MRYITGSRSCMFSCCMSILARSTRAAVGELAGAHPPEQVEVLVDRPIAVRALDAGLAVAAALCRDRLAVLVVDVGEALDDEVLGPLVELLEVVGWRTAARRAGSRAR